MAVGSVSPSSRSVTAPEASRPAPERPRTIETQKTPDVQERLAKELVKQSNETIRVSRENKDNGNSPTDLYQSPSLKQSQTSSKPTGTLVNVTA